MNHPRFTHYWETMKREYMRGTHIAILTARGNYEMIRKFFLNNEIDIKNDLIFCCGDPNFPWKGNTQEKKAKVIEHLMMLGYKTFVFFDDNLNNLLSVKNLEEKYKTIKVITVHAKIN